MEYVDGGDLAQWMRTHPVAGAARLATARALLVQAGHGLAAAHTAGLVHRDFKPSNVLVSTAAPTEGAQEPSTPRARVADFGLARPSSDRERGDTGDSQDTVMSESGDSESRVTKAGTVVGTRRYMAPEQQRGEPADARSDQFSFCVTGWELMFGTLPWPDGATDEPPRVPGHGPRWIADVLRRGLD